MYSGKLVVTNDTLRFYSLIILSSVEDRSSVLGRVPAGGAEAHCRIFGRVAPSIKLLPKRCV